MWLFLPNGITILLPKGSHQQQSSAYPLAQRQSSAYLSAQRWSLACPLGEFSDVIYGGSWNFHARAPKGHLPHRGGNSIHICHPEALSCIMWLFTSWPQKVCLLLTAEGVLGVPHKQSLVMGLSTNRLSLPGSLEVVPLPMQFQEAQLMTWAQALYFCSADAPLPFEI